MLILINLSTQLENCVFSVNLHNIECKFSMIILFKYPGTAPFNGVIQDNQSNNNKNIPHLMPNQNFYNRFYVQFSWITLVTICITCVLLYYYLNIYISIYLSIQLSSYPYSYLSIQVCYLSMELMSLLMDWSCKGPGGDSEQLSAGGAHASCQYNLDTIDRQIDRQIYIDR